MGPGLRNKRLTRLNQLKSVSEHQLGRSLETLGLFKQAVMENLLKNRQEP